jgi:hypothetical protein
MYQLPGRRLCRTGTQSIHTRLPHVALCAGLPVIVPLQAVRERFGQVPLLLRGEMSRQARDAAVTRFQTDPSAQVGHLAVEKVSTPQCATYRNGTAQQAAPPRP